MLTLLKAGVVVGILYWVTQKTQAGAAAVSSVRSCPPGTLLGPWFSCVPACPPGWIHGTRADGTGYCYGGGNISILDDAGTVLATAGTDAEKLIQQINPFTGLPIGNGTAATGVDGNTISVDVDGPITNPEDPRLDGNGANGIQI